MNVGTIIDDKYELVELIASGGMGSVYRARHLISQRMVALKVLHGHIAKKPNSLRRFRREASAASKVDHPGLVQVLDAGSDANNQTFFIAMELLTGQDFREWLDSPARTVQGGIELILELLDPLDALHAREMVHRDLKPENIYLSQSKDGVRRLKILDFGIARCNDMELRTDSGVSLGTPQYMAPEQVMHANRATPATDIWAVGVMLYEALTGSSPFEAETPEALLVKACSKPHRPIQEVWPAVPMPIVEIIDHCLEKDPKDRISEAMDLKRRLLLATNLGTMDRNEEEVSAISIAVHDSAALSALDVAVVRELEDNCMARLISILPIYGGISETIRENTLSAFFIPENDKDDAAGRACACGLAMQIKMAEVSNWSRGHGGCELQVRIGIATGGALIERLHGKSLGHEGVAAANILRQANRIQDLALPGRVAISAACRGAVNTSLEVSQTQEIAPDPYTPAQSITTLQGIGTPFSVYAADIPPTIRSSQDELNSHESSNPDIAGNPSDSWHSGWGLATTLGPTPPEPVPSIQKRHTSSAEIQATVRRKLNTRFGAAAGALIIGLAVGTYIIPLFGSPENAERVEDPIATGPNPMRAQIGEAGMVTMENTPGSIRPAHPTKVMERNEPTPTSTTRRVSGSDWRYELPQHWTAEVGTAPRVSFARGSERTMDFEVSLFRETYEGDLDSYRQAGDVALRQIALILGGSRATTVGPYPAYARRLRFRRGDKGWQRITVNEGVGYLFQCKITRGLTVDGGEDVCLGILNSFRVGHQPVP